MLKAAHLIFTCLLFRGFMEVVLTDFKGFKGQIVINPITNIDRYKLIGKLSIGVKGDKSIDKTITEAFSDFNQIAKLMEYCGSRVISCDLEGDGVHYQSWNDLNADPEAQFIMMKVMTAVLGMSDKKKRKSLSKKPVGSTMASQN